MVYMWWIVEWTVVGFGRLLVVHFYNRNTYGGWKCCGRSDMLYNNYRNSFWKAVFQNRKIVSDAIWGGDDQLILIKRNIFAMFLIYDRPCKADIHCMIQYFLHHFGAVCLNDLELLIRIFLIEFHKNLRKQILCRYRRRRNRNTVFFFLFILQKCLFNFFLQRNNLFCRIIQ